MKEVVLNKLLGYLQIDEGAPVPEIGPSASGAGTWIKGSNNTFYQATEIDITGLTVQELTFFPTSGSVQRGPVNLGTGLGYISEQILVTVTPIQAGRVPPAPGQMLHRPFGMDMDDEMEFQNIIWGRAWTWNANTALPGNWAVPVNITDMGSGSPTNGDTLYIYRFISVLGYTAGAGRFAEVGPARLIITGQLREEAEYQQIMRLRRSYELQQTYDED